MCGRFTLFSPQEMIAEVFGVPAAPFPAPSYNIAPTRQVAAVRVPPGGAGREIVLLRWGFIPAWAEAATGSRMINARAETAASRPAFGNALRRRRCLIPADGFYEWKREGARRQPWYVRRADGAPFAFAGLWERWKGEGSDPVESCVILTTEANDLVAPLHDRMPAIVAPRDFDLWLDPSVRDPGAIGHLLAPAPKDGMVAFPVNTLVNDPRFDDPRCIESAPA